MSLRTDLSECRAYVAAQVHAKTKAAPAPVKAPPAVTISRQAGARGRTIAAKLCEALRARAPADAVPWTVFDQNLVRKALEDGNLPADLEKFLPEDATGEIESSINEILGRHPSLWTLFERTVDTIARLCHMGHCIIVGRAGNIVARNHPNVLHLRFIGSPERRTRQMVQRHGMEPKAAAAFIKEEDAARRRYMKQHFARDIDDPLLYDLVVNTDRLEDDAVVDLLLQAVETRR